MTWVADLWRAWRLGFVLALIFGLCALLAFLGGLVLLWLLNSAASLFGASVESDTLFRAWLYLAWIWLPLGFGIAAPYAKAHRLIEQPGTT